MNSVCLIGRLTKDPDVRTSQSGEQIARYTLAVDRMNKRDGAQNADFISCVCFGKTAEFAQRFLQKGVKIGVTGRIQTGSYTNKENVKIYTTDVIVNSHTFCERVGSERVNEPTDSFQPVGIDEDLPFA